MFASLSKITNRTSSRLSKHVTKEISGQIIALGGGGFSDLPADGSQAGTPDNLMLDLYILLQAQKLKPKVLFLPTAGGDNQEYIDKFYNSYRKLPCQPMHLSLSKENIPFKRLEQIVLDQDVIFVGGGSPRFLMQVWRKCGMNKIIKKAWKQGIILSGMSAGSICWFEDGFTNPKGDLWRRIRCLEFLEGSFCPHYDKRSELRKGYRKMISTGEISPGYGVHDNVALHYIGTEMKFVISSVPEGRAFHVKKSGYRVTEKEIKPFYLGS